MRVNAAFAGFFNCRFVVGSGIAMVLFALFCITSSFTKPPGRDLLAKQVNLLIRQTGHQLLLQSGDSTSRILPVTEIKEGTFLLRFENDFIFNHDSLIALSQRLLPKEQFPSGYTVTVHDCVKSSIVYGFQVNNNSPDILACTGRSQPSGCYTIEFAFPDFYKNATQQKADMNPLTGPVNANQNGHNPKLEEPKASIAGENIGQRNETMKANAQEVNAAPEEAKSTTFEYLSSNMVYAGIVILLGGTLLIGHFRKNLKPSSGQIQNQSAMHEPGPQLAALGKFLFNVKEQHLLLESEVVTLTDKECKVLTLLHKNFGELIPRETLMQEVWINEGVITGRSLDMFVSKLRKKLSHDPALRITNVHGKGYKLEMPEGQTSFS